MSDLLSLLKWIFLNSPILIEFQQFTYQNIALKKCQFMQHIENTVQKTNNALLCVDLLLSQSETIEHPPHGEFISLVSSEYLKMLCVSSYLEFYVTEDAVRVRVRVKGSRSDVSHSKCP